MSDMKNENNNSEQEEEVQGKNKTASGLDENLAGLLCYVVGFVTGLIFLLIEKENHFVRFHALQSIIVFVALLILNYVLSFIPFLGWAVTLLVTPLTLVLWIVLMIQAYQGKLFKLPIIGDITENQLKKMKS